MGIRLVRSRVGAHN